MAEDKKKRAWRAELPDVEEDEAEEARLRRKWEREQELKSAQREKRLKEERRRLRVAIALLAILVLVIVLAFVLVFRVFLGEPGKYHRASRLLDRGEYAEAIEVLREIVDYKDAREKLNRAIGLEAQRLVGREDVRYATSESAPWLKISDGGELSFDEKKYTGDWSDVIVPDVFDGVLVTGIAEKGFAHCERITSISISECVERLGTYAFLGCEGLTSLRLPERLTRIGEGAFEDCTGLTEILLGSALETVDQGAFSGCIRLGSLTLPDSTAEIGARAFNACTALTEVSIGRNLTSIGSYAFSACESLETLTFRGTLGEWQALGVNIDRTGLAEVTVVITE